MGPKSLIENVVNTSVFWVLPTITPLIMMSHSQETRSNARIFFFINVEYLGISTTLLKYGFYKKSYFN